MLCGSRWVAENLTLVALEALKVVDPTLKYKTV